MKLSTTETGIVLSVGGFIDKLYWSSTSERLAFTFQGEEEG